MSKNNSNSLGKIVMLIKGLGHNMLVDASDGDLTEDGNYFSYQGSLWKRSGTTENNIPYYNKVKQ